MIPGMGIKTPEESYGSDCRLWVPDHPSGNPLANAFHIMDYRFVLAHIIGWVVKALIVRDWLILMV